MMILNFQFKKIKGPKENGMNYLLDSIVFQQQFAPFFCVAKLNQKRQTRVTGSGFTNATGNRLVCSRIQLLCTFGPWQQTKG
jgi:hypothetical protein